MPMKDVADRGLVLLGCGKMGGAMLQHLEAADRLAELLAVVNVGNYHIHTGLHDARGAC